MEGTNFSDPQSISRKFWRDIFDLFRIRKKIIHWGTVYDSITKQPIDPAVVFLIDFITGEILQTAITDLWGKYGFLTGRGDYLIRVERSNYLFPSKKIKGGADGIYEDLYYGGQIRVRGEWDLVTLNIPLDPTGDDYNQQTKRQFAKIHPWRENIAQWIFNLLYWGGYAAAVALYLLDQGLIQMTTVVLFSLLFLFRFLLPPRPLWGKIFSAQSGEPLAFVDMELFIPKQPNMLIAKTRSAPGGKYFLKVREGKYILRVTDPFSKQVLGEGPIKIGADGLLTSDIFT